MLQRRVVLAIATLLLLTAMRTRAVRHPGQPDPGPAPADVFTFSNTSEVTTRHVALDLTVDFEARTLSAITTLTLDNPTGTRRLVLDTWGLSIHGVFLEDGSPAPWFLGDETSNGQPLNITIEPGTRSVRIEYTTSPGATGLNWNTAAQSYGRTQPYLYSLNEPIGARSWIPIQDTPSMRVTYDATLRVPAGLMAVMSANGNPTEANDTGVYSFQMPYRIPPYLIAMGVGRLAFQPLDERTGVYAEPELLEDAAWELQYLPEMVDVAETIAGPFPFRRHDLLLMPPTFTVGGMEHPMLNFINPFSVVTGNHPADPDPKSLIAHELAHSWAGDLATLATWNDVWLNEGITSYLTLRILEEMTGAERAELAWFLDRRSYASYVQNVRDPASTILHREVPHPFAGFGSTGYTKGSLFIKTLEDHVGRESFDAFLRRYFQTFSFRWVDDRAFLALLRETLLDARPGLEQELRLAEWIYGAGLPTNVTAPESSSIYDRVQQRAASFAAGTPIAQLAPSGWTDVETELFLQLVPSATLRPRMSEVDAAFGLSFRVTPPISWLSHAAAANYQPAMPAVERVLARGGTNNSVVQLYFSLSNTAEGRTRAVTYFNQYRDRYLDGVEQQIAEFLGLTGAAANVA